MDNPKGRRAKGLEILRISEDLRFPAIAIRKS
jgi:hypothetical protein